MKKKNELDLSGAIIESTAITRAVFEKVDKKGLDLILYIISMVQKDDNAQTAYILPFSDVCKLYNPKNPWTSETKELVYECVDGLSFAGFVLEDEQYRGTFHWIEKAIIDKNKKEVRFYISDDIRKFYLAVKERKLIYTLQNIISLRTLTQARLYTWLYDKKGFREKEGKNYKGSTILMDDALKLFANRKTQAKDFVYSTLPRALKAINALDLKVEYELNRQNPKNKKQITSITFYITDLYKKPETKRQRTPAQRESDRKRGLEMWKENQLLAKEVNRLETENTKLKAKREQDRETVKLAESIIDGKINDRTVEDYEERKAINWE